MEGWSRYHQRAGCWPQGRRQACRQWCQCLPCLGKMAQAGLLGWWLSDVEEATCRLPPGQGRPELLVVSASSTQELATLPGPGMPSGVASLHRGRKGFPRLSLTIAKYCASTGSSAHVPPAGPCKPACSRPCPAAVLRQPKQRSRLHPLLAAYLAVRNHASMQQGSREGLPARQAGPGAL